MFAKSSIIPCTIPDLHGVGINVHVLAVPVVAFPEFLEKVTYWHFCSVVFMQKFTVVSFLAQVSQPMLANNCSFSTNMAKRTVGTSHTQSPQKQFTECRLVF
jgi:hypothetical protein